MLNPQRNLASRARLLTSSARFLALLVPVMAAAQNNPPVVDAGPDQFVFIGGTVLLQGSATDADGDPITIWQWAIESSPPGSNPSIIGKFSAFADFQSDTVGHHVLSLIAFDGMDWSLPDTVVITYALNLPPTAVALANPTSGLVPLTVQFDGTQSVDPEGSELLYAWFFTDGTTPEAVAAPVHTFQASGSYNVLLQVEDDWGQIDFDNITITVLPPELDATDSGRYSGSGFHDPNDTEYQALVGGTRSFFVFDLSGIPVSQSIVAATLILDAGTVTQGRSEVSTTPSTGSRPR